MPDGVRIGTTPLSYPIDPVVGELVLILKDRGYRDQTITVPADHDSDKTVALVRIPARAPVGAGSSDAKPSDFFSHTPAPPASSTTPSGSIDPFAKPKKKS